MTRLRAAMTFGSVIGVVGSLAFAAAAAGSSGAPGLASAAGAGVPGGSGAYFCAASSTTAARFSAACRCAARSSRLAFDQSAEKPASKVALSKLSGSKSLSLCSAIPTRAARRGDAVGAAFLGQERDRQVLVRALERERVVLAAGLGRAVAVGDAGAIVDMDLDVARHVVHGARFGAHVRDLAGGVGLGPVGLGHQSAERGHDGLAPRVRVVVQQRARVGVGAHGGARLDRAVQCGLVVLAARIVDLVLQAQGVGGDLVAGLQGVEDLAVGAVQRRADLGDDIAMLRPERRGLRRGQCAHHGFDAGLVVVEEAERVLQFQPRGLDRVAAQPGARGGVFGAVPPRFLTRSGSSTRPKVDRRRTPAPGRAPR